MQYSKYMCTRDRDTTVIKKTFIHTGNPASGTIPGQANYELHKEQLAWEEARTVCMAGGMDLIVVESREVNDMISGTWSNPHPLVHVYVYVVSITIYIYMYIYMYIYWRLPHTQHFFNQITQFCSMFVEYPTYVDYFGTLTVKSLM